MKHIGILETSDSNDCENGCGGYSHCWKIIVDGKREYGQVAVATCFGGDRDLELWEVLKEFCDAEGVDYEKLPKETTTWGDDPEDVEISVTKEGVIGYLQSLGHTVIYEYEDLYTSSSYYDGFDDDDLDDSELWDYSDQGMKNNG